MSKQLAFNLISKYRAVIMGLAIIMIMFCHFDVALEHNDLQLTTFAKIMQTGTVGVDIFLLLSGFGLYYSYTKKPLPYFQFEKKRILRVLPWYLVTAGITYFIYDIFIQHSGLLMFIQDYSFVSWLRFGRTRYWYIFAIIVFYLIFPLIYKVIKSEKCNLIRIILFSIVWIFGAETFCIKVDMFFSFRMMLSRLPIFILGAYFAKLSISGKSIKSILCIPIILMGPVALVALPLIPSEIQVYFYYPVRALLAISIVTSTILIMEFSGKRLPKAQKAINAVLGWFGGLTLEMYLLHQSYLILFEYPYNVIPYIATAFLLPVATAGVIFIFKNKFKKDKKV